jgi:membrane fusion protein (multidrug efflux system)
MAEADPATPLIADTTQPDAPRPPTNVARRKWLARLGTGAAVAGLAYGGWYMMGASHYVSTDNAYVGADVAQVTPLVSAAVAAVNVADTQQVKRGDVLLRLDDSDARVAVAQAEADLALARRRFGQTSATSRALAAQVAARDAEIVQARAQLIAAQAAFDKARIDLHRRSTLAPTGAVSGDELTAATNGFAAARANLALAQSGVAQASSTKGAAIGNFAANDALIAGTGIDQSPDVRSAAAKLQKARLDLDRTVIRAPMDGVVTNRAVQVGQKVAAGNVVMTLVPLDRLYVDANFKEGQLSHVKIGQRVELTSDLYGGSVVYRGRVLGFSGGTGSAFALIPAQNATGNWIKVVQRLPVRVALDPRELVAKPLRVGLSMDAVIDTRSNR